LITKSRDNAQIILALVGGIEVSREDYLTLLAHAVVPL